jgi:hypothetical protein
MELYQVNWDVTLDKNNGRISFGLIIRDCAWAVLAEALAALYAVKTCSKMGFHNIILEGDALQIVKSITT